MGTPRLCSFRPGKREHRSLLLARQKRLLRRIRFLFDFLLFRRKDGLRLQQMRSSRCVTFP